MLMKHKILFMIAGVMYFMVSGCALQEDITVLDDRIARVEQKNATLLKSQTDLKQQYDNFKKQNQTLQTVMNQYTSVSQEKELELRDRSAGMQALLDSLREENKVISGRLEESQYLLQQKLTALEHAGAKEDESLNKLMQDLDALEKRIVQLEKYLNFEASEIKPGEKKADGPAEKVFSESELYALAKQAFDQNNFEASRQGFQRLLKLNPKSDNADNAQFWIGETYYCEKWYEKAILEYQKVIENYPGGNKVQAALLKQGLSFYNLGDKANARLILNELIKKHPQSNEAKVAQQKLKVFQ